MGIKETLKKAAGLIIEFPEDHPQGSADIDAMLAESAKEMPTPAAAKPVAVQRTIEQVVRDAPGPNLDEIKPQATSLQNSEIVISADGKVNFAAVYGLAHLPTAPFTAEQTLEVLNSLPKDLPIESKRTTMRVTIGAMAKAMGVTYDSIVADASRKLAALSSYSESFAKQANEYVVKTESEIANLEQQIADKKQKIEDAKAKQAMMTDACEKESDRLDDVLEFFSLDVPPSKNA